MARYEHPQDPRESELKAARARRHRAEPRAPFPWLWLGMGVVVTILSVLVALTILNRFLAVPPLTVAGLPTPTILFLTAPPNPTATVTPLLPTPSPIPTLTPIPTPDLRTPPPQVTVGYYARVANTADLGVTVRGGPNTTNLPLGVVAEGTTLLVIGGPREGGEFIWWQVQLADETQGWVAGDFLLPAASP